MGVASQHRYFVLPEEHTFESLQGMTHGFFDGFIEMVLKSNQFGHPHNARLAIHIRRAFEGKAPGEVVELRVEEWRVLADAAQNPAFGNPTAPGCYVPDFIREVIEIGWYDLLLDPLSEPPEAA